jgi:hypothetical protein
MTNPKTDHKHRKLTPTAFPANLTLLPAAEKSTTSSAAMIEACDRLGQKLDEVAGLFREQIEAWRQIRPPEVPRPAARDNTVHQAVETPGKEGVASVQETPPAPSAAAKTEPIAQASQAREQRRDTATTLQPAPTTEPVEEKERRRNPAAPLPEAPPDDGLADLAAGASRLVDTLSQSGQDGVGQALERIMAYLENQAAMPAPKVDLAGIMSRLKDLEDQQQTLQSQYNNNRWGP